MCIACSVLLSLATQLYCSQRTQRHVPECGHSCLQWFLIDVAHTAQKLSIPSFLKVAGLKQWTHHTHAKAAADLSQERIVTADPDQPLKLTSSELLRIEDSLRCSHRTKERLWLVGHLLVLDFTMRGSCKAAATEGQGVKAITGLQSVGQGWGTQREIIWKLSIFKGPSS